MRKRLTKAEEAAFYAWSETITDKMMENKAPIDIWYAAFVAGVVAAKSPRKGKKP
jgi:hypothetical protein